MFRFARPCGRYLLSVSQNACNWKLHRREPYEFRRSIVGKIFSSCLKRAVADRFHFQDAVLSLTTKRQQEASKFVNYALRLCCYSNQKPWNSDHSTLYLLDRLIEASFLYDPSLKDVVEVLRSAYEVRCCFILGLRLHLWLDFQTVVLAQHRGTKGGMLSLFRSEKPPPPLLASSHFGEFPWLAFCAIKCEETTFQQFYRNFFSEMMRHPSQSLEHCVKVRSHRFCAILR